MGPLPLEWQAYVLPTLFSAGPVALLLLWAFADRRRPMALVLGTLLLLAAVFPLMTGLSGLDTHAYRGLLQRVFTLAIFPPIGVGTFVLAWRIRRLPAAA